MSDETRRGAKPPKVEPLKKDAMSIGTAVVMAGASAAVSPFVPVAANVGISAIGAALPGLFSAVSDW